MSDSDCQPLVIDVSSSTDYDSETQNDNNRSHGGIFEVSSDQDQDDDDVEIVFERSQNDNNNVDVNPPSQSGAVTGSTTTNEDCVSSITNTSTVPVKIICSNSAQQEEKLSTGGLSSPGKMTGAANTRSKRRAKSTNISASEAPTPQPEEYVLFYDPATDFRVEDIVVDFENLPASDQEQNQTDELVDFCETSASPQPSTSQSWKTMRQRRRGSSPKSQESSPTKKVRFTRSSTKKPARSEVESDSDDDVISKPKRKTRGKISSDSDASSDSSMFEEVKVKVKKVKTPNSQSQSSSSSKTSKTSSDSKENTRQGKFKRINTRKTETKQRKSKGSQSTSSSDDENDQEQQSSTTKSETEDDNNNRGTMKRTRRARRRVLARKSLKSKKEAALELLRKKREVRANKPKRISPEKTQKDSESDEEEESDESDSSGRGSPIPIVDDPIPGSLDYDGSTPSSSSVTSSGETDEEPDLEIGGSEGEKDLKKDGSDDESTDNSDDDRSVKSYSSSEDGTPDDGQNDDRCILCKNLGAAKIKGRAKATMLDEQCNWCKCGECEGPVVSRYANDYDLVCCREVKHVKDFLKDELDESDVCITKHPRFKPDVLQNKGYVRSLTKHQNARRFETRFYGNFAEMYTAGKADYRLAQKLQEKFEDSPYYTKMGKCLSSYLYWIFDQLGDEKHQMVIPACVHNKILNHFGYDRIVRSFRANYECGVGPHCTAAMEMFN